MSDERMKAQWFRWHHGTTTDRKWPAVAARAGTNVAAVIAVWACLLESASQSADRGYVHVSDDDAEDLDLTLGLEPDTTRRIVAELCRRGMLTLDNRIEAWERRQPKREREDDTAAERKRRQRERERENAEHGAGDCLGHGEVTPCHATSRQVTPRGEERRVEEKLDLEASASAPREAHTRPPVVDMAIALNSAGFRCTARNPDLLAYEAEGGDVEHLLHVASDPACAGKAAGYVLKFARRELAAKPASIVVLDPSPIHARAGPPAALSKTAQGIASLEGLKRGNQLAAGRNRDGAAEARDALPGTFTRLRAVGGDGGDVG